MSQYLINTQRAIAQTHMVTHEDDRCPNKDPYSVGWHQVQEDLEYGLKLSEQAIREHLDHWLSQPDTVLAEDQGYYDRCKAIQKILENGNA